MATMDTPSLMPHPKEVQADLSCSQPWPFQLTQSPVPVAIPVKSVPLFVPSSGIINSTPASPTVPTEPLVESSQASHSSHVQPAANRRCGCKVFSFRTLVLCILWIHFLFYFLATVFLLIVVAVLFHLVESPSLRNMVTEEGGDPIDYELLLNNTPMFWMCLAMYLVLYLVTGFGIKVVRKRRLVAYKVFVGIHCVALAMETVATFAFEAVLGVSFTFIVLRVLATVVLFRYISVMAKERERSKQLEVLEMSSALSAA